MVNELDIKENSIEKLRPDLAEEWDYFKNGKRTPGNTSLRCNKKIWWVCKNGHSWSSSPDKRVSNGTNCHYCSNRKVMLGFNDLLTTNKDLVDEWDFEKNQELRPEQFTKISQTKVWWKCKKCDTSWNAMIRNRTIKGTGCPKCSVLVRSQNKHKTELRKSGSITDKNLILDFDKIKNYPLTTNDFTPFSNKSVYWKCHICGYEWKAKVSSRKKGSGCPCCSNRVVVKGLNDLKTTHPKLANEMDALLSGFGPEEVTAGSGRKAVWMCPNGHRYKASIGHRSNGTNCPICNKGRQTSFAEQTVYYYIRQMFPDAISQYKTAWLGRMELDIYIPSIHYAIEYDGIAWHKDNKLKNDQLKYRRCQENCIKLIRLREESLEKNLGKDIADYMFGCNNLHEHRNLENVMNGLLSFLRIRFPNREMVDVNIGRDLFKIEKVTYSLENISFSKLYPELAKEWHPTKNGESIPSMYKPHSDKKAWWICSNCKNEYVMKIGLRSSGSGCPKCAIKRNAEKNSKKVKMIDSKTGKTLKIYNSISEAGKVINTRSSNISMVCNGQRKHAAGYKWEYVADNEK